MIFLTRVSELRRVPCRWTLAVLVLAAATAVGASAASASSAAGGTARATTGAAHSYDLRAWIDGRSDLILTGGSAHWHHFDYAAPGRLGGSDFPTYLDGVSWLPT